MQDAHLKQRYTEVSADVLAQQKTEPAGDDEEHHTPRIAAQYDMESQAIHGGDHKGEYEYRVRHCSCDSVFQW